MNASAPLFSSDTLLPTLRGLCSVIDAESAIPKPGSLTGTPEAVQSADDLRERLAEWIGSGEGVTGWLLTTDALHVFPGTSALTEHTPLHAELHRAGDDVSLNLRHTPQGWICEELTVPPENSAADAFLEKHDVMIALDPDQRGESESPLIPGMTHARYQVEWRLTEAPQSSSPATFRPARSRFTGWVNRNPA